MKIALLLITITLFFSGCKNYRLSDQDVSFNPYKVGDTLFFQSENGPRDTLIVGSIDRMTLRDKSYSVFDFLQSYFRSSSEGLYVTAKRTDNHGEAGNDILTIWADKDGSKTLMFDLSINGAYWYGGIDNLKDLTAIPSTTFSRNPSSFNDVIIVTSPDKEYRKRDNFIERLYWSRSFGYVGFDMLNGIKWTVTKSCKL